MEYLITALIIGLGTGFHCLGMCGPIAFALPVDRSNKIRGMFQNLIYQIGRLITYSLMGLLFGVLGKGLSLAGSQQYLSIATGVMMIVIILWPTKKFGSPGITSFIYKNIGKIKSKLGELLKKRDTKTLFAIGLLNGTLPCGPVYAALVAAIASGTALKGALFMFVFGLGTIPFMFAATFIGNFMSITFRNKVQKVVPVLVVVIGILFILRGLGLGIHMVSPPEKKLRINENQTEMKCGGSMKESGDTMKCGGM
ncbi:MAG: sulfite exporter TauE/SafE family protein [Bacteroidota bacterium]